MRRTKRLRKSQREGQGYKGRDSERVSGQEIQRLSRFKWQICKNISNQSQTEQNRTNAASYTFINTVFSIEEIIYI